MTFKINTRSFPLSALFGGGSTQLVRSDKILVLDGSGSKDPDVQAGKDQGLTYVWACTHEQAGFAKACTSALDSSELKFASTQKITIAKGLLAASPIARKFTLIVRKGPRSSDAFPVSVLSLKQN